MAAGRYVWILRVEGIDAAADQRTGSTKARLGGAAGGGGRGLCRCGLGTGPAGTLAGADRGLATELAYGAIRRRRSLDGWLDRLGKIPAAKQPPKLRWLLHVGLYQLLWMERIPPPLQ